MATKKYEMVVFNELDFSQLNTAIEKLGSTSKKLTEKEKEIGTQLLTEWEKNVIEKIENKRKELSAVRDYIKNGAENFWGFDEAFITKTKEQIVNISGTKDLYNKYLAAKKKSKAESLKEPKRPTMDPNKTINENDRLYADYERELVEYNITARRLEYVTNTLHNKWMAAVRKSSNIKKMIIAMDNHMLNLSKYKVECKDRGHLARLNVAISDEKAREAIKEIIEFTKQIK
jgi:hypothetical protein